MVAMYRRSASGAESAVDGFFPGDRMRPEVGEYPCGAPFGVAVLA